MIVCMCVCVYVYVYLCICAYVYECMYVCMCVPVYVCMCVTHQFLSKTTKTEFLFKLFESFFPGIFLLDVEIGPPGTLHNRESCSVLQVQTTDGSSSR